MCINEYFGGLQSCDIRNIGNKQKASVYKAYKMNKQEKYNKMIDTFIEENSIDPKLKPIFLNLVTTLSNDITITSIIITKLLIAFEQVIIALDTPENIYIIGDDDE